MTTKKRLDRERKKDERAELDALIDECEEAVDDMMKKLVEEGESFENYERKLLELVHEVARRKLEKKLQSMADSYGDRLIIDHNEDWHGIRDGSAHVYRRHAPGTVTYHSIVGSLQVRRYTYRECGFRSTYVPLELDAGIMERMTPAMARCLAIAYAHMPSRQCEQLLEASGLRPPSRSTLDRCGRDLGSYAVAANASIEPVVRSNEVVDPAATVIAIGLDRTAVPMREGEAAAPEGYSEEGLRRSRPKPRRKPKNGPVEWKMDYVATVCLLDEEQRSLAVRKYRLPSEADPDYVTDRVMADVRHALVQRPGLRVVVVQDGAPEIWRVMTKALRDEPLVTEWAEVLDWYHLDERLTKCLDLCAKTGAERRRRRKQWHQALFEDKNGLRRVIRSIHRSKHRLDESARAELEGHISYLRKNTRRATYKRCRAQNLPIGSGATEGACKSVVAMRAKRSGQRWSQRGLTAALHLRSIHQSDRFAAFWELFAARYRANHITGVGDWG